MCLGDEYSIVLAVIWWYERLMQILRTSALKRLCSNDAKRFFFSVFFVFLFLVFTCCFYSPRWETNDDIAMSMVAHGYGLAAYSSPQIIFSNVLWGHVVRNIPSVFGVLGYSLATLFSLFASGVGILYFLRRLGVGWTASAAVTVLALLRPAIFPQFTLNSGLLTIVAVLALVHYVQVRKARILGVALLFGLVGFLIRSHQFAIVLFASLPFLQLNVLYRDRKFRLFVLSFLALLSFAIGVDWLSYCGPEWAQFFEINGARAAYTDFGLATQLKRSPEIIQARGYSNNDLDLITSFFFSDPSITRPENLREMQTALGTLPFVAANVPLVLAAVESFFSVTILPITALACVLFAFRPSRKGAAAFLLVISCASLLGLIGRGGLDRVLAPLVTMLAIFSMINISRYEGSSERRRVVALGTFSVLKCSLAMLAVAATFWFVNRQALVAREQV
jgi:hypothetical protein